LIFQDLTEFFSYHTKKQGNITAFFQLFSLFFLFTTEYFSYFSILIHSQLNECSYFSKNEFRN